MSETSEEKVVLLTSMKFFITVEINFYTSLWQNFVVGKKKNRLLGDREKKN